MIRRHGVFAVLVAAAAVLRALVMLAYQPAFWFFGDSGTYVTLSKQALMPHDSRALGYVLMLKVFGVTGISASVVAAQHLAGLLIGVAAYALAVRRGLPRWLACLAATPVLFDARELAIEHYLLTETLFTALLFGGVLLLLWWEVPGPLVCAASGLLVAGAWFTRPNALPIALLLAGYLVIRRLGWRPAVAFAAAFAVPYAAVMLWVGDRPSSYGSSWTARLLYARTAQIADCDTLDLTAAQRAVCPTEPLGQRSDRADWYVWNGPALDVPRSDNGVLSTFAIAVVRQQPGDYARAVARETAPLFLPGQDLGPGHRCLADWWDLPATARDTAPIEQHCHPALARPGFQAPYADPAAAPPATALTRALHGYSAVVRLPAPLVTLAFLLVFAALVTIRRGRSANVRDAGLLALVGASLLIPPVLIFMYDARYTLPVLPFVGLMAALAADHLRRQFADRQKRRDVERVEVGAG